MGGSTPRLSNHHHTVGSIRVVNRGFTYPSILDCVVSSLLFQEEGLVVVLLVHSLVTNLVIPDSEHLHLLVHLLLR